MTNVLILIGIYFAVWAALSVAATPYRRHLQALGAVLRDSDIAGGQRDFVEGMLASAYSWRSAVVLFLIYVAGLFQSGVALDRDCERFAAEHPELANDARIHEMIDAYFASVAAVNPLFGVLAFIARFAFQAKARLHHSAVAAERMTDFKALSVPA